MPEDKLIFEVYSVGPSKWKCSIMDRRFFSCRLFVNAATSEQAVADAKKCADALGLDVEWERASKET